MFGFDIQSSVTNKNKGSIIFTSLPEPEKRLVYVRSVVVAP